VEKIETGYPEKPSGPYKFILQLRSSKLPNTTDITGRLVVRETCKVGSQQTSLEEMIAQDAEIQAFLNKGPLNISYHIDPNTDDLNQEKMKSVYDIMTDQAPHQRIKLLAPAANIIDAAVEDSCKHFDEQSIRIIVGSAVASFHGRQPSLEELTNLIILPCYQEAFARAEAAIEAVPADLNLVTGVINATHTFANTPKELLHENYVLLPNIFKAILTKTLKISQLGLKQSVQLIQNYDREKLNLVITELRNGINSSLGNSVRIGRRLDVTLKSDPAAGNSLTIELNAEQQKKSIKSIREANEFNHQVRSSLLELTKLLRQKGLDLELPEEHFSFYFGQRARCPVEGDSPYTEQVYFLYRILAVVEQYL